MRIRGRKTRRNKRKRLIAIRGNTKGTTAGNIGEKQRNYFVEEFLYKKAGQLKHLRK
jgi:hypothetical protein